MCPRSILVVFTLLFLQSSLFGQQQTIRRAEDCAIDLTGIVESTEGERLPGASILIEDLQQHLTSDNDGSFAFTACPGGYNVQVSYVGYETIRLTVRIPAQKKLVIRLKPATRVLHDLIVEGLHQRQHDVAQSVDILSDDELRMQRGKALGDMTQQLSGVTSMNSGPGIFKPVIQGLHSQRVLILNNNVRQEGQQWGVEHAPEIDSYIASEIEVVKGAETVRYGSDALGGVIIVSTPSLHYTPGLGGEVNINGSSNNRSGAFSGSLEGGFRKIKGIGWRIQGTLKKGGDYHTPEYNMSNTGMEEANGSATIGLKRKDKSYELYLSSFNTTLGILRSSHTGNLDDLETSIRSEKPWYIDDFSYDISKPRQEISHHLLKAKTEMEFPAGTFIIQYALQLNHRREFDIRRSSQNDRPGLSLALLTQSMDLSVDHHLGKWSGSVGLNGTFKDNDNELSTGILPDYQQGNLGLFVIERRAYNKWNVEVGGRLEYQHLNVFAFDQQNELVRPSYDFYYGAAAFGAAYRWSERLRLTNHLSYSVRPPHTSELFSIGLHHSAGAIEEGLLVEAGAVKTALSGVKKESSGKLISSLQWSLKKATIELSGHINYFQDFVYLTPYDTRLTIRGYFPVFRYGQRDVLFVGGEFTTNVELTQRMRYKINAAYLHTESIGNGDKLPMMPPGRIEQHFVYTLKSLKNWKNVFVRLAAQTFLQQFNNPPTRYPSEVVSSIDNEEGTFDFMAAPPGYTLFNVAVGGDFPWGNRRLSVTFSCDNVLNTEYRSFMNRLRYFTDEPGRNFSLQLSYQFHSHKQ